MKFILLTLMSLCLFSCTSSRDRYWDLTQKPNTKWRSNEELSNIIRKAFPFIHVRNIHGRKGWVYLSGITDKFLVGLDIGERKVVVSDTYYRKENKYQSEKGGDLEGFLEELIQVLKQKGIEVDVGKLHYTYGIYID